MSCKNCGNRLVMVESNEFMLNENGVYDRSSAHAQTNELRCIACRAVHEYEIIHEAGDQVTIALAVNSDPMAVAVLGLGLALDEIVHIESPSFIGLLVLDESKMEVARFNTHHRDTEWWDKAVKAAESIPKGEWKANYGEI